MEQMKNKRALHSKIKQIIQDYNNESWEFPCVLSFTEGMGKPSFTITIEKDDINYFIDDKGQKWVKSE